MRNIFALASAIKNCIPNDVYHLPIKKEIDDLTKQFYYKAPEQWGPWFGEMSKLLSEKLGIPNNDWKKQIDDLFSDNSGSKCL